MSAQLAVPINAPSLPKGGGAIQSSGKGLGAVGVLGAASYEIGLPISPGRGFFPSLSLHYSSAAGNGVFGLGWGLSLPVVARRTSKGVPAYNNRDEIIGPGGIVWMPERGAQGARIRSRIDAYNELKLGKTYSVVRHFPRVETTFERIEHWFTKDDQAGFWLVHGVDGSLHLYGKSSTARRADAHHPEHVGEWLLEESLNAHGEHILYRYTAQKSQRYLCSVHYGNFTADAQLYAWSAERLAAAQWHFELLFDYGERSLDLTQRPAYTGQDWQPRSDNFCSFAYGFELRTERLCRQVLMFHRFPDELGAAPVLVRRLLLEYRQTPLGYQHLSAAHDQAYDDSPSVESRPPLEFSYSGFNLEPDAQAWQPFQSMPALNDGQHCQWVDLYGEGLPGVLYSSEQAWYYREPLRARDNPDGVTYDHWRALPRLPRLPGETSSAMTASLSDLTGDGRLDWVVARPGMSGFFSLKANRDWSDFATFNAFPVEFSHPQGQLADVMGQGLSDFVMIGPRSVRLYASRREKGFAAAVEIARSDDDDALPVAGASPSELVAFSDMLGSGQPHWVRIRHDEVKCWPNLGRGRFGKGIVLGSPGLAFEAFDPSRIRLADLDGSGGTDLIYLHHDHAQIFMNRGGNGFASAIDLRWPTGVSYDRLCQVSVADLQGLGCSSLVLSVPHGQVRHWRYDFFREKPYLLTAVHNNMGAVAGIRYRSSAQEWLDEKQRQASTSSPPVCQVPFALPLVSKQTRFDEITGNRLTQVFSYRQGFYDGIEREFRGFGLLLQTDSETIAATADSPAHSIPCLKKLWFHTGQAMEAPRTGYDRSDKAAVRLGKTVFSQFDSGSGEDIPVQADRSYNLEAARALSGRLLRIEHFGLDPRLTSRTLYSVEQHRYRVRLLQSPDKQGRYARLLPLTLESIRFQYDGFTDDPQCQHTFDLRHDAYGALGHSVTVHYARRKTASDEPPFSDVDQQQWWRDAHDPAQQFFHIHETRAQFIHLENAQSWRLGLPYRQRTNALQLARFPAPDGWTEKDMSYEKIRLLTPSEKWVSQSVLTSLSVQRYQDTLSGQTLPDGVASYEALADYLETAELDDAAMNAFDVLPPPLRPEANLLERSGYQLMADSLAPSPAPGKLWSVNSAFATYASGQGFYRPKTAQASKSHGVTEFHHDRYHCLLTHFKLPDGCTTSATHDYRLLQPLSVTDPNGNVEEALYDAFGQQLASTCYRPEQGSTVGFKPLAQYQRPAFDSPTEAINNDKAALHILASATYYAPMSWMGRVSAAARKDTAWLQRCVTHQDLLPGGYLRAGARARLSTLQTLSADDMKLKNEQDASLRLPVHAAVLVADRFPDDDARQIRITVTDFDGFGRALQHRQKVEPGMAWVVDRQGQLTLAAGQPEERFAAQRWRVSERVEYNDKGLPIRTYRPYFADQQRYVDDVSLRSVGPHDQQFYDALDRPTHWRLAGTNGVSWLRRRTYHPWYTVDEDPNDTLAETEGGQA